MNLWPKRLTRLLCVAVALCAVQVPVSLAQGETPPDQLVVGMSMINLLSLDLSLIHISEPTRPY